MITLKARYGGSIEVAITKAKALRDLATVAASDGAEVYEHVHRST